MPAAEDVLLACWMLTEFAPPAHYQAARMADALERLVEGLSGRG